MSFLKKISGTNAGWGVLALRLALGVIFVMEGTGKLYGWFGGGVKLVELPVDYSENNRVLVDELKERVCLI